jgi:hypothetical protein
MRGHNNFVRAAFEARRLAALSSIRLVLFVFQDSRSRYSCHLTESNFSILKSP